VLESVTRTGKLLIVHEDTQTGGFAAEIMALVSEKAFTSLDAPIGRLATPDVPIPYNIPMMERILPGVKQIGAKITELLAY
jgi:2-oxoisovalerate dehydrogenase E1 component